MITAALLVMAFLATLSAIPPAGGETPVVRAVMFSSPTCSHCATVREEVLPPLAARYGPQLQVAIVSTATPNGQELFLSACMKHGLMQMSVPLLVVGNTALVGSTDIPEKFPGLIDNHLAAGGVDWPPIPGLRTMLASAASPAPSPATAPPAAAPGPPAPAPPAAAVAPAKSIPAPPATAEKSPAKIPARETAPAAIQAPESGTPSATTASPEPAAPATSGIIDLTGGEEKPGIMEKIRRDLYGNSLAILLLVAMIVVLLASPKIARRAGGPAIDVRRPCFDALIPLLILAGILVAGYLSMVEVQEVEAVCGPVGDCNTVQQSEYARLFGILPIGVLGLGGFAAILAAWVLRRWGSIRISLWAAVVMMGMTAFGLLFSIYLTFLEPFVIGATCLWCLSSATIMTLLFVLSLGPGVAARARLGSRKGDLDRAG